MENKVENWCGHPIRFVKHNDEWWAVLKDVCDALGLTTWKVRERLDANMIEKIDVSDLPSKEATYKSKARKSQKMLIVNESGIYEALFASRKLEARKFRLWTTTVLQKLRKSVGLEGFEVMKMTEPDVQQQIDHILDTLYWDEEKGCLMRSVTIDGGDVDQVSFED